MGAGTNAVLCDTTSSFVTRMIVPASGVIKNLRVWMSAAQGAGDTCAFYVRTGTDPTATPTNTALTCSVVDTAQSCTDLVNTPSVTAGQGIEFYFDEQGGTCVAGFTWTFELTPS